MSSLDKVAPKRDRFSLSGRRFVTFVPTDHDPSGREVKNREHHWE